MCFSGLGNLNGQGPSPIGIDAKDITNETWDYIFLGKPFDANSKIEESKLKVLRNEFL